MKNIEEFNHVALEIARLSRELTQKEVSESLGVTQSYFCQLEKGQGYPSEELLGKISEVLGYPKGFFFSDIDWSPPLTPIIRNPKYPGYK